jgi:hypothetical protein
MQEQRETVGMQGGLPVQISETITRKTSSEAQAGPDVAKAVAAAMAGFKGDIIGAMQGLKPQPIDIAPLISAVSTAAKPGGMDAGSITAVAGAGIIALQQYLAKRKADADAEAEWKRANDANAREVELAKQLPPTVTQTVTRP